MLETQPREQRKFAPDSMAFLPVSHPAPHAAYFPLTLKISGRIASAGVGGLGCQRASLIGALSPSKDVLQQMSSGTCSALAVCRGTEPGKPGDSFWPHS